MIAQHVWHMLSCLVFFFFCFFLKFYFIFKLYIIVLVLPLTIWDPDNCSPPGFSVHVIFQARILKRVASSYSRSSWTRDQKRFSCALTGRFFYHSTTWKASYSSTNLLKNSSLIWNCSNQRKETNQFLFHTNFFSKEDKIQSDISQFFSFSYCLLLVNPSSFL